jgi:hypothetical protein
MIQNPTPITASTFSGMWVTNFSAFFPVENRPNGLLIAGFSPFDGAHLLATGGQRLFINNLVTARAGDATFNTQMSALTVECKRLAGTDQDVEFVSVRALDPSKPITAATKFVDGSFHNIRDCMTLAGTDATFAAAFNSIMGELARKQGLSIS